MDAMSARLSEEIWLEILQQFVGEPRQRWWTIAAPEEILALMLVSKQWLRLSEPLLYRYLRIFISFPVGKLLKAFDMHQAWGKDCARWVRAVYVSLIRSEERLHDITAILSQCSTLRRADCVYSSNFALLSLFVPTASTMRTMNICLDPHDHSSISQVVDFKNLRDLHISFCPGSMLAHGHNSMASLSNVPPWSLPELRNLHLIPSDDGKHVDLQYLARWSFPKLKSFTMDHFEKSEAEIKHVASFLDAHPHISSLSLKGLSEMLPLMSHVRCPELRLSLTQLGEVSRTMVQLLRPEVVRLNLSYIDFRAEALWSFLDGLCTQPKGVRRVHIGIDRNCYPRRNIDWVEQHQSRMNEYASVLGPLGVQLSHDTNPWPYEGL